MEDLELGIAHAVQQHVHAGQVVGGDVLLLAVELAHAVPAHPAAHVEQQRARAAGEIQHPAQLGPLATGRVLGVQNDDGREDARDLLRGVELPRLFAAAGGELTDQVLVGIAQEIALVGELRQAFGNPPNDDAQLLVALGVGFAELVRVEVDLREQPLETAAKGFVLDELEAVLQRAEQIFILGAGHLGDAVPEVFGFDDVVHLAAHHVLEGRDVVRVLFVPHRQRRTPVAWGQARASRFPIPVGRLPRSCPRDSAKRGRPACSRGSRRRSSRRARCRRWPRASCPGGFGLAHS